MENVPQKKMVEDKIERNLLISTSTLAERNQWRNSATSLDAAILGTCVVGEPENAEEVQEWMGARSDQNLFFGHFLGITGCVQGFLMKSGCAGDEMIESGCSGHSPSLLHAPAFIICGFLGSYGLG
jgi:hypothetical protein